jgi:hypothetical protein
MRGSRRYCANASRTISARFSRSRSASVSGRQRQKKDSVFIDNQSDPILSNSDSEGIAGRAQFFNMRDFVNRASHLGRCDRLLDMIECLDNASGQVATHCHL